MSNGIIVNGDDNSLLFSTNVDTLFFQGKATLASIYKPQTIDYVQSAYSGVVYGWPDAVFYEYNIELPSSVTSIMPFVYNSIQKRIGISNVRKTSSTNWNIFVFACTNPNNSQPAISSSIYPPEIYVFSNYVDAPVNTGTGINTFDATGKVTFTTNERPLLIKASYTGNVPYSNLQIVFLYSTVYCVNGPWNTKNITSFSPMKTVGAISKPAIFFGCTQSCRYKDGTTIHVWECSADYDASTTNLNLEWAKLGVYYDDTGTSTIQSSTSTFFSIVIDAADYD